MSILKIATKFPYPGPRYKSMGDYSGEEFRDEYFIPWLKNNKDESSLIVDLDGVSSYPPSFLEEIFGGAVRKEYAEQLGKIRYICEDEPELIDEIKKYIEFAKKLK